MGMFEKPKKLPGHNWSSWETVFVNGTNRFRYKCSRCQARVLDGEAFPLELLWECK